MDQGSKLPKAPEERPVTIYLNEAEWVTVQATPSDLKDWAVGYLCGEGVISGPAEIASLVVEEDRGLVWADVPSPHNQPPVFQPPLPGPAITVELGLQWMEQMLAAAPLYQETGGMHVATAVRIDTGERILREDIGRHNAVDKVLGRARLAGWPPEKVAVLTSGRISYEMCTRLARFGAGIGLSRTAATDQAYRLAMELGIDLVGYLRSPASLVIYTAGNRVRGRGRIRHAG